MCPSDLLVTFPLAYISDKYGRRVVFVLNTTGLTLMWAAIAFVGFFKDLLPVEAMLVGPVLTILGGGDCVFMSTVTATMTDIAPDETVRSNLFAYVGSISYVTTIVAPSLAAFTMSLNLWLPFILGLALLLIALPTALRLPGRPKDTSSEHTPLLSDDHAFAPPSSRTRPTHLIKKTIRTLATSLTGRHQFQLLLGVFFLASFASSNTPLLVQYISKRYGWTFAQAGYLLSAKAAVNVTLLTVIVPALTSFARLKWGARPVTVNIFAMEISIAISVAGAIFIAIAGNIASLVAGIHPQSSSPPCLVCPADRVLQRSWCTP